MLGLSFSFKLVLSFCIVSIAKTAPVKIGVLPYSPAKNTIVMSGMWDAAPSYYLDLLDNI